MSVSFGYFLWNKTLNILHAAQQNSVRLSGGVSVFLLLENGISVIDNLFTIRVIQETKILHAATKQRNLTDLEDLSGSSFRHFSIMFVYPVNGKFRKHLRH